MDVWMARGPDPAAAALLACGSVTGHPRAPAGALPLECSLLTVSWRARSCSLLAAPGAPHGSRGRLKPARYGSERDRELRGAKGTETASAGKKELPPLRDEDAAEGAGSGRAATALPRDSTEAAPQPGQHLKNWGGLARKEHGGAAGQQLHTC